MELEKHCGSVYSVRRWRHNFKNVKDPKPASINGITSISKVVPICKATLKDIHKELREKPLLSTDEARQRLPGPVKSFTRLFADENAANDLPPLRRPLDHAINLRQEDEKPMQPPWGPLCSMSWEELLVLRKTLAELLEKDWISPSSSPAALPVLFPKKPNGGLRFCAYFLGLNSVTLRDRYPLPLFKGTLRQLTKAKWFTELDIKSAFHRVRLRKGGEWMTAFRCRHGLFKWLVTPFGLVNVPATFQRYINLQLRNHLDINATTYIEYVLVYINGTEEQHWKKVQKILSRPEKAGLFLDIHKCDFLYREVKYLGYIIRAGESVTVDPAKVKTIWELQAPTSVKEFRSFHDFANFYRCFVDGFSEIAAPLIELTKKNFSLEMGIQ